MLVERHNKFVIKTRVIVNNKVAFVIPVLYSVLEDLEMVRGNKSSKTKFKAISGFLVLNKAMYEYTVLKLSKLQ